jgi:hypothetical protein
VLGLRAQVVSWRQSANGSHHRENHTCKSKKRTQPQTEKQKEAAAWKRDRRAAKLVLPRRAEEAQAVPRGHRQSARARAHRRRGRAAAQSGLSAARMVCGDAHSCVRHCRRSYRIPRRELARDASVGEHLGARVPTHAPRAYGGARSGDGWVGAEVAHGSAAALERGWDGSGVDEENERTQEDLSKVTRLRSVAQRAFAARHLRSPALSSLLLCEVGVEKGQSPFSRKSRKVARGTFAHVR